MAIEGGQHYCRCTECYCALMLPIQYHPTICPRCLDGDHMNIGYVLPTPFNMGEKSPGG